MRSAVVTLAALAAVLVPSEEGRAQYAPWCAIYSDTMAGENCGFPSFEQCRVEVRGIGGLCYPNPWYAAAPARRPYPARTKRRR
jgi:hypothetical protein